MYILSNSETEWIGKGQQTQQNINRDSQKIVKERAGPQRTLSHDVTDEIQAPLYTYALLIQNLQEKHQYDSINDVETRFVLERLSVISKV